MRQPFWCSESGSALDQFSPHLIAGDVSGDHRLAVCRILLALRRGSPEPARRWDGRSIRCRRNPAHAPPRHRSTRGRARRGRSRRTPASCATGLQHHHGENARHRLGEARQHDADAVGEPARDGLMAPAGTRSNRMPATNAPISRVRPMMSSTFRSSIAGSRPRRSRLGKSTVPPWQRILWVKPALHDGSLCFYITTKSRGFFIFQSTAPSALGRQNPGNARSLSGRNRPAV